MKVPQKPPDSKLLSALFDQPARLAKILSIRPDPCPRGKYLHWDELRRRAQPDNVTHEEWWLGVKLSRMNLYKQIPLVDESGGPFQFLLVDPIPERLHRIDQDAGGRIAMRAQITNQDTRDQYYVSSLIEEAITSSQLEGAATTRAVAKEMLRTGRTPKDRSERMILNNYRTMRRIGEVKDLPLTKDLVFELHRLVTDGTLPDAGATGRFRRASEEIVIADPYNTVLHTPPPADQLDDRMAAMCAFANGDTPAHFVHPALRSIILHFWLAYDHPFIDGNGRVARALFYWSMLRHGFWLCEFISISHIILRAPVRYGRAFLYTETDDNDLTYFILYHLDVLHRAIDALHDYIARKTAQLRALEAELRSVTTLNHRQRQLIGHALRHPHYRYTVESHRASHNVVYQTARTDLLHLVEQRLLEATKVGRTFYFIAPPDLGRRLAEA